MLLTVILLFTSNGLQLTLFCPISQVRFAIFIMEDNMKTEHAIKVFGTRRKLADALGISTQATYQWGDTVPKLRSYEVLELEQKLKNPAPNDE